MKKSELEILIALEVEKQVKVIVAKLVKPLVQESVAGALASLLAEGISRGVPERSTPKILTPNVSAARSTATKAPLVEDADRVRERLRNKLRAAQEVDPITPIGNFGNGMVGNILNETAGEMISGAHVDSILDSDPDDLESVVDSTVVRNITKDYSALMSRMAQQRR